MRRPNQSQPDPPGGRAAARREEFLAARFGPGAVPPDPDDPDREPDAREHPCEEGDQPGPEDAPSKT